MRATPAFLAFLFASSATALAAGMPADCSKAPVPAGAVKGDVAGTAFVPVETRLANVGSMSQNDAAFDTYRIFFKKPEGDMDSATADVTFLVPKGKLPDGRSFKEVPGSISKQPMAAEGLPEIQGWSFDDDATGASVDSVFTDASSLQLSFAKRAGGRIAGTVYLCAPGDKPFWLAGHFDAELK